MRYECRHSTLMFVDGASDLQRGQHHSARSVQSNIHWDTRIGEAEGAQHFLRVVHVYVAKHRKAQEAHRLLPMHEQDDARLSLPFDTGDEPLSGGFQETLFKHRLE